MPACRLQSTFSASLDPLSTSRSTAVGFPPAAESRWLPSAQRILHRPRSSCFDFRPLARFARKSFVANGEPAPRLHYICGPSAVHLRNSPWVQEADALPLLRARRRNRRILQPNRFGKRPPAAARCTASAPSTTRFSRMRKWLPLVDERVEGPLRRPVNMILVTG